MTTQTTYSERMAPPSPGTIAGANFDTTTGICETAAPGIGFGLAVSQGTLSDQGVILGGTAATFRGVSVKDVTLRGDVASANLDHYQIPDNVAICHKGEIWVEPTVAVNANDPVWFDGATGTFNKSTGIGPIKGARWKTSCGIGGRAIVELAGYNLAT
jgi:hypothetical protein